MTHVPQDAPFMDPHEVAALEACLASWPGPIRALEWGAGGSTVHFGRSLPRGSRWLAVEHDARWAVEVRDQAARSGLASSLEVHHVPPDATFRDGVEDGDLRSFRSYVLHAVGPRRLFDFILVDGRARVECLRLGWELLADGGVLALHDAQRREYDPGIPDGAAWLRLTNGAVHNEGPIQLLLLAREPARLAAVAERLAPLLPAHIGLSVSFARAPACASAIPAPALLAGTSEWKGMAAPARGSPSCLFVNTCYPEFLREHYRKRPELAGASYQEQLEALNATFFGDSDFYSRGLARAGWRARDIVVNCGPMQARWAAERSSRDEGLALVAAQIREERPDVVYLQNLGLATRPFLEAIRPYAGLVVGQIASALPREAELGLLDLVVSSFPHFVQDFRARGIAAQYQPLAFEPRVLSALPEAPRDLPVTFVGGLASHTWKNGTGFLDALAREVPVALWGYGVGELPADSPIRQRYRGEAWGLDMFGLLRRSRITLNRHSDVAQGFANNMRLFEATGCGALVITDQKDNLDELFRVGEEVVAYRSPEECVALVKHFLGHVTEAAAIARAGQARTLRDHTYEKRMARTAELLEHHLRRKRGRGGARRDGTPVSTGMAPIAASEVTQGMRQAWKDPRIPERQRELVERELGEMIRGRAPRPYQALAESLAPFLRRGDSLLEIGCASGYYHEVLDYLLGLELDYVGVDYSQALVDLAREIYPRARFEVADGARLPFADGSFEAAVSSCVLLHVEEWRAHVAEAARVARSYVVAHRTPLRRSGPTAFFRKLAYGVETVELRFSEREILAEFERHGLRLARAFELHADPAHDEFWQTWVFAKPGAPVPLE